MIKIKYFLSVLMLFFWGVFSINAQKYNGENDDFTATETPFKLGIKIGLTQSGVYNQTLQNAKPSRGLNIGFYYRRKMGSSLHFQSEVNGVMTGSKFSNGLEGYSRFSMLYMQIPLQLMINLDKKDDHHIVVGIEPAFLLRSQLFIGNEPYADYYELPLYKTNALAVLGYHFNTEPVGFRIAFKYGMFNINRNLANYNEKSANRVGDSFQKLNPTFSLEDNLRIWNLDFTMYF